MKEEGGRVCCVNLDVKKNETTEQDPPVLALALTCSRPGQGPPEVAGIKVPVSTRRRKGRGALSGGGPAPPLALQKGPLSPPPPMFLSVPTSH